MTVNSDGTVTVGQQPSGGRTPGTNTSITKSPLAKTDNKVSKIRTAPGKTVAGTGKSKR